MVPHLKDLRRPTHVLSFRILLLMVLHPLLVFVFPVQSLLAMPVALQC